MTRSKADTLRFLTTKRDPRFVIDSFVAFRVREWDSDSPAVLARISGHGLGPLLAVRSSALSEDATSNIPPGLLLTRLGVPASCEADIRTAVRAVIDSYNKLPGGADGAEENEVLVQQQAMDVVVGGVLTSLTSDLAPFFVIEYDDASADTDTVTRGHFCKRVFVHRNAPVVPARWERVIAAARAVEEYLETSDLIVEFALAADDSVHVFQARRRRRRERPPPGLAARIERIVEDCARQIEDYGPTVWSDMADWNPAEMLGDRPRPLEISLYEYLVTDATWAEARASLGYAQLSGRRLMYTFACKPYIDVRASFESLTPADLHPELRAKLVADRLDFLRCDPSLHDKIEFDVCFASSDVAEPRRTTVLLERGFTRSEVAELDYSLLRLTNSLLEAQPRLRLEDAAAVASLESWRADAALSRAGSLEAPGTAYLAREALDRCRGLGVLPFARQARLAFIGRDLVDRLVAAGALAADRTAQWWQNVRTVAADVADAFESLASGTLPKLEFDRKFGHLRPRSYDITSPRYDRIEARHLPGGLAARPRPPSESLQDPGAVASIDRCLAQAGISVSSARLFAFVAESTVERESLKFGFTAVLSDLLEALAVLGEQVGFERHDIAFLRVEEIVDSGAWSTPRARTRAKFARLIEERKLIWEAAERTPLPQLILSWQDFSVISEPEPRPNFVGAGIVEADVIVIEGLRSVTGRDLTGAVVAVEAADPGFDWIFAYPVAALVTRFGGAGSHMAVRCAEFGIPAVIGCGEALYREICTSGYVRLDCSRHLIETVNRRAAP